MQLQREIQVLRHGLDEFGNLIFPKNLHCICCEDLLPSGRTISLCDSCKEKINWVCDNPLERQMDDFAFDDVLTCCIYGFYPRKIISSFKLSGNPYIARPMAYLMAEKLEFGGYNGGELLVPVPMYDGKKKRRGFNQTEILAKYISKLTGLEYHKNLVVKIVETKSSRESSRLERLQKNRDIYLINQNLLSCISGRNIIIVDDVLTTGSTADGLARFLKGYGAQKIKVLCFASGAGFKAETIDK